MQSEEGVKIMAIIRIAGLFTVYATSCGCAWNFDGQTHVFW